ncbi:hypothetical protein H6A65_03300 [Mediterraneibacter glycyrrhizinilyticus]|uniref:hypothetical protein n=1 Tax=Mediterraneibacter glycyrrhizinilyticus TaxID=342942 RepID=UPI00195F7187|nr:hypothetical protein [Mediterraneibacter glycyrrhizinilyticus]MBM6750529.1 hypothetical protein [Mediterraneibacter glycyrrhizinilyticus]
MKIVQEFFLAAFAVQQKDGVQVIFHIMPYPTDLFMGFYHIFIMLFLKTDLLF